MARVDHAARVFAAWLIFARAVLDLMSRSTDMTYVCDICTRLRGNNG